MNFVYHYGDSMLVSSHYDMEAQIASSYSPSKIYSLSLVTLFICKGGRNSMIFRIIC